MTDQALAEVFDAGRQRLLRMAVRMLGSTAEAEDAVQEAWLRLGRSDAVENVAGWLTTVTARICLNLLRARAARRESSLEARVPDLVVLPADSADPEHEAVVADSVSLALLVVLDTLAPAERLALVLHDVFAVPFDEIATMLDRSPEAVRKAASRARQRVQGATAVDPDRRRQRAVVDAFFAAARDGDLDRLVAVLHPDVVLRSDGGAARPEATAVVRGAVPVAGRAVLFARPEADLVPVLVDGTAGVVVVVAGTAVAVMGFTVVAGRVIAVEALTDPDRVRRLDLAHVLGGQASR
jgi:RNA polymerase sigma factor (sigma-70 family)